MTQLWMDGFDHYGIGDSGITAMLEGPWAEVDASGADGPQIPGFGARSGNAAMRLSATGQRFMRRVVGANKTVVMVSLGIYLPALPDRDDRLTVCSFLSAGTVTQGTLYIQSDGKIALRGEASEYNNFRSATLLGQTSGPVLTAGTWHHVEVKFTVGAGTGACEVRVDETQVLNLVTIDTGAADVTQFLFGYVPLSTGFAAAVPSEYWYDDLVVRDTAGSLNNDFQGDLRVATLQPIANGVSQGWSTRSIEKLGVGVLRADDNGSRNSSVTFADNAALEIAAQSYTVEGFFRFERVPVLSEEMTLLSKYRTDTDNRSWRLYLTGPDAGGLLKFSTSTDGTLADVVDVHGFPFIPITNRWYHIAVERDGTTSRLFIDGQQVGIDQTDSRTYFDSNAAVAISGRMDGATTVAANSGLEGWVDGVRFTIGLARYGGNFAPPTSALPTDVSGDPDYNSVELLMNFDNDAVTDESSNAFTGVLRNGAVQELPDDSSAFQTIDGSTPNDFDFVEAALISATGTLTFTANPLDTEQVVIGSTTYTFQTVLVDAPNNVLIGATTEDSLDNLLAAVNLEAGAGTLYGTGTVLNPDAQLTDLPDEQVLATASTPGAIGNSVTTTTTVTGGSWSAGTLLGGADIPSDSEFTLSDLPAEVTGVRAVAIVNRAFKTDSGSSNLQASFVVSGGSSSQGADRPITTSPTYYEDTFETDPQTAGAITPSTLVDARIRVDRTL